MGPNVRACLLSGLWRVTGAPPPRLLLRFDHFGKNRIKEMGVSPDGFAQMAMQLAYYLRRGHLVATYESCAMRNFLHGRTETVGPLCATPTPHPRILTINAPTRLSQIRSASPSCQAFVEAFTSTSASVQEKVGPWPRRTLARAARSHSVRVPPHGLRRVAAR